MQHDKGATGLSDRASPELTILSRASAGALLTLSTAVVGDARLRLPGPQLVRGVSKDEMNDVMAPREQARHR